MSESVFVKTLRDGTILINDATPVTPLAYSVSMENGDFSGALGAKADRVVIRDRHAIAGLREGADPIPTFSFSVHMREFKDASATTIIDVIEWTNTWSAGVSVASDAFEQKLHKVTLTVAGTGGGTVVMNSVLLTYDFAEGDPDSLTINGEIYGAISRTGP
jgi:hypothetical protein